MAPKKILLTRASTEGFDKEALEVIALTKIEELKGRSRLREKHASTKEGFAYWALNNSKKYSVPWFYAQVYLYKLEAARESFRIWLKYWEMVGGIYQKPKFTNIFTNVELERARSYPVQNLCGEFRRAGTKFTARCPFHNPRGEKEKSQSFFVFDDNSFHCFSCGAHGWNCVDFVMQKDKVDFKEAVMRLL